MKRLLLVIALGCGVFLPVAAPRAEQVLSDPGDPAESKAARTFALGFLQQVDAGKVGATWSYAGDYLRGVLTRAEWEQGVVDARASVGALHSRDLLGAAFTPKIEGEAEGHFFVVFYVSRFGDAWFQEKVVVNLKGSAWKLEGYYITPSDAQGNAKKS